MASHPQPGKDPASSASADLPAPPAILGMHHFAFRCRDAAETRWFYETVCGLDLQAALSFTEAPGSGLPLRYMHLFFKMQDGRFVAFFDCPDSAKEEHFKRRSGFNLHFAMEAANEADLLAFKQRWEAHGFEVAGPIDHHFCKSIYTYDPNGIQVEVTCRAAGHDAILEHERAIRESMMARWTEDTAPTKRERALRIAEVPAAPAAAE
jgi:catechol 2,3-dioxygenase-like lactoylglutathione lyase family enzyme